MKPIKRETIILFLLWLLIVPPGVIYSYLAYPPQQLNFFTSILFIVFGFFTVYFPIRRNESVLFLVMWITVPAFLLYGLFFEIIVMQISILAILFRYPSKISIAYRFYFNSLTFFFLSISAAYVFQLVGGEIGSLDFWPLLLAVTCYQFVHTTLDDFIMKGFQLLSNKRPIYYTKNILLKNSKLIVMIPLLLTLYFLIQYIGMGAFLLVGVPYFSVTLIVRLYNNTEKVNMNLRRAGDIGHQLSVEMSVEDVIDEFAIQISKMFATDMTYIFDYQEEQLELIRSYKKTKFVPIPSANLFQKDEGIMGFVLKEDRPVIYQSKGQWEAQTSENLLEGMESIVCLPIMRNQKNESVLLLASKKKRAFREYQLKIIDLLCSYFTVAVEKARYLEKVVAETKYCVLTGLHNYRYLEERLQVEIERVKIGDLKELSLVMLDIDFFKTVNDTYGHQSGNDILCMLAEILEEHLPLGGVISRYGGEEFVYLLPNTGKEEAIVFAEDLRLTIEKAKFTITPDLGEYRLPVDAQITVSIGISNTPEDTEEASVLLRNADRTLYLGAKQAGRNRVAGYVK